MLSVWVFLVFETPVGAAVKT